MPVDILKQFGLEPISPHEGGFQGKIIVPDVALLQFSISQLIDWIISLKHQAKDVGWISGSGVEGIEKSLDSKLNAAKDAVDRGQDTAARSQLQAFLNEVEAQKGKALNNSAYLLLKLNAEYILSKLPEKQ